MQKIKVENMESSRGNIVANQFIIVTDDGIYFQSYRSIIAFCPTGSKKIVLDTNKWDYSRTTGKYRNTFLNENKRETQAKIDSGEYKLADLNI
jgi:hypothetical protein